MGSFCTDVNVTFDSLNSSNNFTFDILIEPVTQIMIPEEKANVDGETYLVDDITNRNYMIFPLIGKKISNEATINNVFDYGDKIMVYVKSKFEISYRYIEMNLVAFVLEHVIKKEKGLKPTVIVI